MVEVDASKFDSGFGYVRIFVDLGESVSMHDGRGKTVDKYRVGVYVFATDKSFSRVQHPLVCIIDQPKSIAIIQGQNHIKL